MADGTPFTDAELEAALGALSVPGALRDAETLVAAAAPGLHRVLGAAISEGGWLDSAQADEARKAAAAPDPAEREVAMRTLLAEEARLGMMIGVVVGWALNDHLRNDRETR